MDGQVSVWKLFTDFHRHFLTESGFYRYFEETVLFKI